MNEKIEIEQDEPTRPGPPPDLGPLFDAISDTIETLEKLDSVCVDAIEIMKKSNQENSIELIEGENEETSDER